MDVDPRDEIWNGVFNTYYDAYFEESFSGALARRWQKLDEITKGLVAITASGSAVAGWALWTQPGPKMAWSCVAGVAAVLSIVSSALRVSDRLKHHTECERRFSVLRSELETLRYEMRIDPTFPIDVFTKRLIEFRKRLTAATQMLEHDLLSTMRLRFKIQEELDTILSSEIVFRKGKLNGNEKKQRSAATETNP